MSRVASYVAIVAALVCTFAVAETRDSYATNTPAGCASVGIAPMYTVGEADADLERDVTAARDLGATRYRFDIDWSVVEPRKGEFDWAPIDRIAKAVRGAGLIPLGVLAYTPEWARTAGASDNKGAPKDPADYAAFAGAAAAHFAGVISEFEIWNEPNNDLFWAPTPDATAYAALVQRAYPAIKAAQPGATVLAGAMAPGEDGAPGEIDPVTFLQRMYDAGAGGHFDAVSVHPYTYPALPTDPSTQSWSTFQKMPRLRDLMVAQGDGAKGLWITEFGAPTGDGARALSPEEQAHYLSDGITAARGLGYIPVLLVYSIRDSGTNRADTEQNFGLLTHDFQPKPSYAVVSQLAGGPTC